MKKMQWLPALLLALAFSMTEPEVRGQNPVLQEYIREGLQSNQGLRQRQLDYTADLSALREARGLFFPDVSLQARYTVADGGRIIDFPVGDLLNPVYSTLNLLTGSDAFPQIENESFPFFRPTEHETKLSLRQPIYSPELVHNLRIRREQSELTQIGVEQYRRELVRDITKAYYGYARARSLVRLADTTLRVVEENLRVSRSLFENDKVTIDAVYRSESERSKVEVQRARARSLLEASRSYFNFLLNRELDAPVELDEEEPVPVLITLDEARSMALQNRPELKQIEQGRQVNEQLAGLYRSRNYPGLFGVVDYGFQGEEYRFTGDDDFVMASLVLRWNIFQGNSNREKVRQAMIEGEKLTALREQTRKQVSLEVIQHYYGLITAYENVLSARKQVRSARRAFELIDRKYGEGQATLLELIDARTSLTEASSSAIVARSEYFIQKAEFEYATSRPIFEPENHDP